MAREDTLGRIIAYVKKIPDVDPEIVKKGLSIFHLHREIEMLVGTFSMKRYALSPRQLETLEILYHNQEMSLTPAQLAEEIHLTRSAMTSNLDSLERKGYLSRLAHPDDRRSIIIGLTQKGTEFCERIIFMKYKDMESIVKALSPDDREALESVYNKIIQALEERIMEAAN